MLSFVACFAVFTTLFKLLVIVLTVFHSLWLLILAKSAKPLSLIKKLKLAITGFISGFADTMGIGSFAINMALVKTLKLLPFSSVPGFVNAVQVLPGTIEFLLFIKLIHVSIPTLLTLSIAAAIGGMLGAAFVSKLNTNVLKKVICACFIGLIGLLVATELGLMTIGGEALGLSGYKLIITAFFMMIAGALSAACVGLYASSQAILFLAGMSPIAAFPIMTAAGAIQQPIIAITFLLKGKVPLKETIIVTLISLLGVACAMPLITMVSSHVLHYLLIAILSYNVISLLGQQRKNA